MELTMKVNGQVVDSVKVFVPMSEDESYHNWLKKELRRKHQHILLSEKVEPLFFLHRPNKQ